MAIRRKQCDEERPICKEYERMTSRSCGVTVKSTGRMKMKGNNEIPQVSNPLISANELRYTHTDERSMFEALRSHLADESSFNLTAHREEHILKGVDWSFRRRKHFGCNGMYFYFQDQCIDSIPISSSCAITICRVDACLCQNSAILLQAIPMAKRTCSIASCMLLHKLSLR